MASRVSTTRKTSTAAQVAASQIALAGSNYLVLALAARHVDAAGFAALSSYYLLINTVGRGLFAAVELETTRAIALTAATGAGDGVARRDAVRHTLTLLVGALVIVAASSPLLGRIIGSGVSAIGLLAVGALAMAASYLVRGPLAGHRRYGPYAATFWIEAGVGLAAAGALVATGVDTTTPWIATFALAPLVAALVLARAAARPHHAAAPAKPHETTAGRDEATGRGTRAELLWSAALLLAGQGVWNLAPVLVSARLADAPALAAGFVTVAVILRAPVLFFPSVQALLLPAITTMVGTGNDAAVRRVTRRLGTMLAAGGVVWVLLAVFVIPTVAHLVFGATITPPTWVLAVLAVSTVVGAGAQIVQAHLVVARRQSGVAMAWIAALAALVVAGLALAPPITAGALGQLAAAVIVVIILGLVRRRVISPGSTTRAPR
ncbi:hypothetical protein [Pseudonocardia acidicola]|uniref:O-antigen/teichoic acid export membrane protein n=1 Tax=Pseudonocardia acidicola TaxID=2724939 RepID=A0ABX1SIY7_9PSEU|nr:hypothetical protein [Pseudonocardia acidicola]